MIKVGINENVYIKDTKMVTENDKKRYTVTIAEVTEEAGPKSILEEFNASEEVSSFTESTIALWPFDTKPVNDETPFSAEVAKSRIDEVKEPLNHILLGYMTKDKIKWNIFAGIPVTPDNVNTLIMQQETLNKVFDNICNQFTDMIKPYLGPAKLFRFIGVRQSKKSHFPTFRKRFLADQPFWEPMEIPAEQSRLQFSSYEIKKGLDSDKPAPTESVTEDEVASESAKTRVFGQRD